jgi:hypothetical protein
VNTSGNPRKRAIRTAVEPSRKGCWECTMSAPKASSASLSGGCTGSTTEKSLALNSWMAGTRSTSSSTSGMSGNSGATTSTRWPSAR